MNQNCSICLESILPPHLPLASTQPVYTLMKFYCGHYLHESCFDQFLIASLPTQNPGQLLLKCPVCRSTVRAIAMIKAKHDFHKKCKIDAISSKIDSLIEANKPSVFPPIIIPTPTPTTPTPAPIVIDLTEDEPTNTSTGPIRVRSRANRRRRGPYNREQ